MDGQKWFKFYGQDWLTDLKVMRLQPEDRLCYITLLCLASASDEQGVIRNCEEEAVIELTHLPNDIHDDYNPVKRAVGCLKRFEERGMVETRKNGDVLIKAFTKRQLHVSESYERVRRYREKKRNETEMKRTETHNETPVKRRVDKNRVDKNREDNNTSLSPVVETTELEKTTQKNIGEVIFFFKNLNPTYKILFNRPPQRKAAERLIQQFGIEKIQKAVAYLEHCLANGDRFCPTITTPIQLEAKWGTLQAHFLKERNAQSKGGVYAI